MFINTELFVTELYELKDEIEASQKSKGLYASGRTSRSLRVDVKKNPNGLNGHIYGSKVFRILAKGRGPGKHSKPSRAMVEAIREWTKIKGIDIPAYAIAFKINRDGIKVPNRFNPGGVLSDPLNPVRVKNRFTPFLKSFYARELKTKLHIW